jgi:hypothetical protein
MARGEVIALLRQEDAPLLLGCLTCEFALHVNDALERGDLSRLRVEPSLGARNRLELWKQRRRLLEDNRGGSEQESGRSR